jgi:hypothetical protein
MPDTIAGNTTLRISERCVMRPQEEQYLFYHSRTDELHLVSPSGFYLVHLCNGLRTVAEIEALLAEALSDDRHSVAQKVRPFLQGMVTRGVLEVDHD